MNVLRHSKIRFVVLAVLLAFTVSACTIAKISGKGAVPLVLNNLPTKVKIISHFSASRVIAFDYTGYIDISDLIAKKIASSNADAVVNLVIKIKNDPATFLLNLVTLGIANARRVVVEGDLVKIVGKLNTASLKLHEVKNLKLSGNGYYPLIVKVNNKYLVAK